MTTDIDTEIKTNTGLKLVPVHLSQKEIRHLIMGCHKMLTRANQSLRKGKPQFAEQDKKQIEVYSFLITHLTKHME